MSSSDSSPRLGREGLPLAVVDLCRRLRQAGHRAWIVGGCVRDSLLSQIAQREPAGSWVAKDWDIATDATPERVTQLFRRVIPTGVEHGTVTVLSKDLSMEVTTLRADQGYADGRRPERVDFVASIEEDLARRDFTVNAIAFEPEAEAVVDPFGGLGDLKRRRLRAVGEPSRRFAEDGLRVLRAARFVATLEFELDPDTAAAIRPSLATYRKVSAERIREEWQKTLRAPRPSRGFAIMYDHGLLDETAPELAALARHEDGTARAWSMAGGDLLSRSLRRVDACPRRPELRLAALLGDVHPDPARAAELADALLLRLRYSNAERKCVTRLIRAREMPDAARLSDAELRRWLRRVGPDLYLDACQVARADALALQGEGSPAHSGDPRSRLAALDELERRAQAMLAQGPPLSLGELAIDGKQLMTHAGLRPGPEIGRTLDALLELVLDRPELNTSDQLLEHARALSKRAVP